MNPVTRKEKFLAKAAGEFDESLPTPVTREEHYLKAIAENSGGSGGGGDEDIHEYTLTAEEIDPGMGTDKYPILQWIAFNEDMRRDLKEQKKLRLISCVNWDDGLLLKRNLTVFPLLVTEVEYPLIYMLFFATGEDKLYEDDEVVEAVNLGYFYGEAVTLVDEQVEEIGAGFVQLVTTYLKENLNNLSELWYFNTIYNSYGSTIYAAHSDNDEICMYNLLNCDSHQGVYFDIRYTRNGVESNHTVQMLSTINCPVYRESQLNYNDYEDFLKDVKVLYTSAMLQDSPEDGKFTMVTVGTCIMSLHDSEKGYDRSSHVGVKLYITACNLLNPSVGVSTVKIQAVYDTKNDEYSEFMVNGNDALTNKNTSTYIYDAINSCLFSNLPSTVTSIKLGSVAVYPYITSDADHR